MKSRDFIIFTEVFTVIFVSVCGYTFSSKNVIVISLNNPTNASFPCTLLLQTGDIPCLIIGAPKSNKHLDLGGDIYKCDIYADGRTSCVQYPAGRTIASDATNGNYFGMSLDGDDTIHGALVACAPKAITSKNANYLRGYCVYMKNSSDISEIPNGITPINDRSWFKDVDCCDSNTRAYYDFAFSMAGFDISFYNEKKRQVLFGAPGVKKYNGATISYSLDDHGVSLLPNRNRPVEAEEDNYFGYSVSTAKLKKNDDVWFVSGAPRAHNLRGKVTIYFYDIMAKEKMHIVKTFEGDEVGSYFGASVLALDVSNDGIMDLIVGAPMAAGKTWDEGIVYFYKGINENSFMRSVKISGASKIGGRFGSEIVSLGDFDLDGFDDVAIASPYEDNGRGAVYIYKGSVKGLTNPYSQRLSPADFNVGGTKFEYVKGFGLGMSRGNDIDHNGHNDIAIGAYKSDEVFIIKTYSIIDYQFRLTPSINTISNDTSFDLKFCLFYTKRSNKQILPQVTFNISVDLDYRSLESKIVDNVNAYLGETMCKEYQVQLRHSITDILPFQIDARLDTETANIIAQGKKSLEIRVPYSHGCGNDNVCETDLSIELKSKDKQLVLGLNRQIELTVTVTNFGEPAYECEVKFKITDGIELRNNKDCTEIGEGYTCVMDEKLTGSKEKVFIFDVTDIKPDIPAVEILAEVVSLGTSKGSYKDKVDLIIPVVLNSTSYIVGKSLPENIDMDMKNNKQDLMVTQQYLISKTGLSPLKLDVEIVVPVVEFAGEKVFDILEVKGTVDNIQVPCTSSILKDTTNYNDPNNSNVPVNRTLVLSCNTMDCLRYTCKEEYLYDSAKVAVFEVKALIRSSLLVSKYKTELKNKDLIAFISVAFQSSLNGRIGASSPFLIFLHGVQVVPLWVYLVAPAIGVILLMLISYVFYRCHFFDRVYKDKLDQEKILASEDVDASIEDEIFDNVVFRPMEEKLENAHKQYM